MKRKYILICFVVTLANILFIFSYFPIKNKITIKTELINKTQEIINEKNYFAKDETQQYWIKSDLAYDIYSDEENYYVTFPKEGISVFTFTKYDNNLYYIGHGDYSNAKKMFSGTFRIDEITLPDYSKGDNPRVTRDFDSEVILQSVINNYNSNEFYTAYLLNSFSWDKSNYLNENYQFDIMIIDKNENVFLTYCYFSSNGWNVGTPGAKFVVSDYPTIVKKYQDTAIYRKANIGSVYSIAS